MAHVRKEMISFFVTTSCNLSCKYCYTNKEEASYKNQVLDYEFAKVGIDDYFSSSQNRHIRFYGAGEPTTKINLIKKIYKYAYKKAGDKLTAEIQTNCVFSKEIADWLAKHINIIWVSSDGYPEIQDYYRMTVTGKPTSEILAKNLIYLIEYGKGITGIRTTITEKTIDKQERVIDYFSSLGVKYIWTDPIFPSIGEKFDYRSFDFMLYADRYLKARDYAEQLGIFYGSFLVCNFDEESEYNCRACLPVPHLTTDGYVSACDMALFGEFRETEIHMDTFIYGEWDKKKGRIIYNKEKIENLQKRKAENMPGCIGCPALKHCAGYCLGEVTNESGDLYGQKKYVCNAIRYLWKKMGSKDNKYPYLHP